MTELVTIAELARMTGLDADTLTRRCAAGRIPGAHKIGAAWVVPAEEAARVRRARRPKLSRPPAGGALEV